MPIRKILPILLSLAFIGFLATDSILAQGPSAAPTPSGMFVASVQITPVDRSPDAMQDVKGVVLNSEGKGVEGISVKVTSPGWQAFDVTKGGGTFKFPLSRGDFAIKLEGVRSQEAKFTVDGKSEINIKFTEGVEVLPTVAVASPTRTATITPTVTVTPLPTRTPVLAVSTPFRSGQAATATPSTVAASQNRKSGNELTLDGGLRTFATGAGFGLIFVVSGLAFVLVRRNRS